MIFNDVKWKLPNGKQETVKEQQTYTENERDEENSSDSERERKKMQRKIMTQQMKKYEAEIMAFYLFYLWKTSM